MIYLGIDLGGTNIAAGLVNEEFQVVGRDSVPTPKEQRGEAITEAMEALVRGLLTRENLSLEELPWVGIGAPGYIDSEGGIIRYANNLCGGLYDYPMAPHLTNRLGAKAYLGNDANAAAYGEALAGAAKGAKSSVTITLGTGVGGGIIMGGSGGFVTGEIGHTIIAYGGERCTCGHDGCLEAYTSATALIRQTKTAMEQSPESALWRVAGGSLDGVNGKTAFDAWDLGDPAAARVVDSYISYLSCGVANVINLLEPEVICIGGGISAQGEKLLAPLREKVRKDVYTPLVAEHTRIVTCALGNDAGIIGAAMLGRLLGQAHML